MKDTRVEISIRTIFLAVLIPLGLYFLWIIRELLFSLLIAFIFMSALRLPVDVLRNRGLPRTASVFIVFFSFLIIIIGIIAIILPPMVFETTALARSFPSIIGTIDPELRQYLNVTDVTRFLPDVTNNVFSILGSVFSNLIFVLSTLFFTLYFLLQKNFTEHILGIFLDKHEVLHYEKIIRNVEKRLTSWFWGQFTLMLIIGMATFVVLNLLGVRYALPLAVLAGMLEVVPNLGPVLASIPAFIVALSDSWIKGGIVLVAYFLIQQAENTILVPLIMKRAVGLNPIYTLIALFVGGKIGGVLGILLSIPILIIIQAIVAEVRAHRSARGEETTQHRSHTKQNRDSLGGSDANVRE